MLRIRQAYPTTSAVTIAAAVERELGAIQNQLRPGMRVGVAVGSRGISQLRSIISAVVRVLQTAKTDPFILPAMGSHGGATPQGQTQLLAEYGITEGNLGVPIRASMEVTRVGTTPEGTPVHCSVEACGADGIVLINRIKPHTDFSGNLGSGLVKMSVIGLGKQIGAAQYHISAAQFGYEHMLRSIARVILAQAPILGGLAILEDQRHDTAELGFLLRNQLESGEERLFAKAKKLMPKLPFDDIDCLIVDQIGKNISGSGLDPNIVGRGVHGYSSFLGQKDLPPPRIKRIFVRELTPETHGNAIGIGFADLTTTRLVQSIDRRVTYVNALTSLTPNGAKIPIHFDSDQEAISMALGSVGLTDPSRARVVRIEDTLSLEAVDVSESYLTELAGRSDLAVIRESREFEFNSQGNLLPFSAPVDK
jgi:hypothetical protein